MPCSVLAGDTDGCFDACGSTTRFALTIRLLFAGGGSAEFTPTDGRSEGAEVGDSGGLKSATGVGITSAVWHLGHRVRLPAHSVLA